MKNNSTSGIVALPPETNGKAKVKRHPPVSSPDMQRIQQSLDLNMAEGLQRKVFIDVMVYFANRGRENLREMETMLKFKSKLNPSCKWMWQRPRSDVKEDDCLVCKHANR